jgi:hypothetical protein
MILYYIIEHVILTHEEYLRDNVKYNFYSLFLDEWNRNILIIEPRNDPYNNYRPFKKTATTALNLI